MTDLFVGLTAAGFPAGPDRLNEVVLALKAADFEWLEDLQDAEGCGGVPFPLSMLKRVPLHCRLQDGYSLRDFPLDYRCFLTRVINSLRTAEVRRMLCSLACSAVSRCRVRIELCES